MRIGQSTKKENLDNLSVATQATLHHEMVTFAAGSRVTAIHREKAMCYFLAEADDMVEACKRNGVKLNAGERRAREVNDICKGLAGFPQARVMALSLMLSHLTADALPFRKSPVLLMASSPASF